MSEAELEHAVPHAQPPHQAPAALPTVPVHAEGQDLSGGHQGVHFTMAVSTGVNPVVQLLGRDYDRLEARVIAAAPGLQEVSPANPAAGAPLIYTLPFAAQLLGAVFTYTASATVGSRFPVLEVFDGSGNQVSTVSVSNGGLTASQTLTAYLQAGTAVGSENANNNTFTAVPLPGVTFPAGWQIMITSSALAADVDQVSNVHLLLQPAPAPVWLSQSKEVAEAIAQQGAAYAGPAGSLLPAGVDRAMRNCDEVWVTAVSPLSVPVSVIVSRRLPVARPTLA